MTPAGYAFAIWGLIYAGSLVLAVYQLLPEPASRRVHRRTGWWLAGAFAASTVWVPIFGTRTIWLSQLVIIMLVVCLIFATVGFSRLGTGGDAAERFAFRLPITLYLGWATLACFAGFGTTFRSCGMPPEAALGQRVGVALVLSATIASLFVVGRLSAVTGFLLTRLLGTRRGRRGDLRRRRPAGRRAGDHRGAGRGVRPDAAQRRPRRTVLLG